MSSKSIPLEELNSYTGSTPCPPDFREFWDERVREAWSLPLNYSVKPAELPGNGYIRFYDVWLDGVNGSKLHAKYVLPVSEEKVPVVLQFHGYPGASRGWFEQASFAGLGMAVLAMECPGQGGYSNYTGTPKGTFAGDHIVMGLNGDPKGLYYVEAFMDTCLMVRLALAFEELDSSRIYANGASQGGGFSLICAALNPGHIRKCASLYPFLTDYRRAWERDWDKLVYDGMKYYFRHADPAGEKLDELFIKLGYIDVLNFVDHISCPVLFGTGLADELIPVHAQYAAYGRITSPKRHIVYPDYGHEEIADFDDRIIEFFMGECEPDAGN